MTSSETKIEVAENESDESSSEGEMNQEEIDIWSYPKKQNDMKKLKEEKGKKEPELHQQQLEEPRRKLFTERFEELQKRRLDMKGRSDHLQAKNCARKAKKAARRALKDPAVRLEMEKLRRKDAPDDSESGEADKDGGDREVEWNKVKTFINANKHLAGPIDHGWCGPKTSLEVKVDEAITSGEFEKAEKLSDQLANRNFAVKVHEAFEAKKFSEKQKEEKEQQKVKRRKTLHWGFEAKQRWEMKSNL